MNVSLNTALYNAQGVDLINVEKTANDILNLAQKQEPKVKAIDYSKFNRATLGIDLYSYSLYGWKRNPEKLYKHKRDGGMCFI